MWEIIIYYVGTEYFVGINYIAWERSNFSSMFGSEMGCLVSENQKNAIAS